MEDIPTSSTSSQQITLREAAALTPGRPSPYAIWRWCRKGVLSRAGERVRLRHTRFGGRLYTTQAWLEEFGQRLVESDSAYFDESRSSAEPVRRPRQRIDQTQQQADIERDLDAAGI